MGGTGNRWWLVAFVYLATFTATLARPDPFAECQTAFRSQPDRPAAAGCFYRLAKAQGAWRSASRQIRVLLAANPENPWLLFNLGRVELDGHLGNPQEEPLGNFLRAAELTRDGPRPIYAGHGYLNAYRILREADRLEDAEEALAQAAEIASRLENPQFGLEVQLERATLLIQRGQLEEAELLVNDIKRRLDSSAGSDELANRCLLELGNISCLLGRYRQGRSHYQLLAERAARQGSAKWRMLADYSLAAHLFSELMRRGGQPEEVLELARQALASAQAAGNRLVESKSRLMLGKLDPSQQRDFHLRECVRLADEIGNPQMAAQCQLALAAEVASLDPELASRLAGESAHRVAQAEDAWAQIFLALDRLRVFWATLPPRQAAAESLATLDSAESLRDRQIQALTRAEFLGVWTPIHYLLGRKLLEAWQDTRDPEFLDLAFYVAERMRARSLLETVVRPSPGHGPGTRLTAERWSPASAVQPSREILGQVQAALSPREALLSFGVSEWRRPFPETSGGSWLTLVTRDGVESLRLPGRGELERKVGVFNGTFARRDQSHALPAAAIYADLLAEASSRMGPEIERLLIVGDGPLLRLPFSALRPNRDAAPLAARFEVNLIPSAALWVHWKTRSPAAPASMVLALVDPEIPQSERAVAALRQWNFLDGKLGRLPSARREGRHLRSRLGAVVTVLEGSAASEGTLRQIDLRSFGILHFAAHAIIDDRDPERSAVVLSSDGETDGLLEPSEIRRLPLHGKLVVLSACSGAAGSVISGEGVLDLARAFFEAGAASVVANLWPLRDDDAEVFFDRFYRHLAEGSTLSKALRQAQSDRLSEGAPAAAWAGFVLLGAGDVPWFSPPVSESGGHLPLVLLGLAVLGAVGGVLVALLRRRSRGSVKREVAFPGD